MEPIDFTAPKPNLTRRDEAIREALDAIAANDVERGIELTQEVNTLEPNSNIGLHLVGLLSIRLNEPGKAVEAFEAASRMAPDVREHIEALAIVFSRTGRLVDGLYYGKLATAATKDTGIPGMLPEWIGTFDQAFYKIGDRPLIRHGERLLKAGNYSAAAEAFRREVELDSNSVEGWRGFTNALHLAGRHDDAVVASSALMSLTNSRAADLVLHGEVLACVCRFDEALVAGREAVSLEPDDAALAWRTVQTQGRRSDVGMAAFSASAENWGRRFVAAEKRPTPANPAEFGHRRARVGVMSGHWAQGDGLDLVVPIIELLDKRGIELFVYADGLVDAPLARRLRTRSNTWQDLTDLDGETAAFLVRNDDLDVLIDLDDARVTNHAALIAQAPAPFALSLHGDLTAALAIGFTGVIGDAAAYSADDPRIVRIEGGLACQPADMAPLDPDTVRAPGNPVVFGTWAEGWQISDATLAVWAEILTSIPGAILLLDDRRLGGTESTRRIAARLPNERLQLRTPGTSADYFAAVDLLLDPIGNLFSDESVVAAAQGTPSITCRAKSARANLVAGWLTRAQLTELVANTPEDYVRIAVEAATGGSFRSEFAEKIIADRNNAAAAQAKHLMKAIATLVNTVPRP